MQRDGIAAARRSWISLVSVAFSLMAAGCAGTTPSIPSPVSSSSVTSAPTGGTPVTAASGSGSPVTGTQASALDSALSEIRQGLASQVGTTAPAAPGGTAQIKDQATGTALSVSLPKDCKSSGAPAAGVYKFSCSSVAGLTAEVHLDLTSKSAMTATTFAEYAAKWFDDPGFSEDPINDVDPLEYTNGTKTSYLGLDSVFAVSDTGQTYGAKYYKNEASGKYALFAAVTDAKGGTAEIELEMPSLSDDTAMGKARDQLNADFAQLAIGLSDALHSHG